MDGIVKLDDVSFTANSGEILGIAGISGCGQKELLEAIAGLQTVESGSISYIEDDGSREELIGKDPLSIAELGVSLSFVPEDRLGMGLVGNMNLADNMMLRSFRRGKSIFTDRRSPRALAESVVQELSVSTPSVDTPVRRLSGGNVQKVLVGREIASAPTVLLTAYAVRGLISIRRTRSMTLSTARRKPVSPLSSSARIWTCCWSCATVSLFCAAARSAASSPAAARKSARSA